MLHVIKNFKSIIHFLYSFLQNINYNISYIYIEKYFIQNFKIVKVFHIYSMDK